MSTSLTTLHFHHHKISALALAALLAMGLSARAGFTLDFEQVGNDVVATGSGTLNTTALGTPGSAYYSALLYPMFGTAIAGAGSEVSLWAISGPSSIGTGGRALATSGTGDVVGLVSGSGFYTPSGYVSGSALSNSAIWANQTFSTLGLTQGTYTLNWGSGPTADFFTLNIGANAVPEPGTLVLAGLGGVAAFVLARRRG